ncbi:MAG: hypothetical protein Q4B70_04215 [Lachnospiraceae bacterium]|nr:hypothetical protein [Lachnospiraceae bacterium]
MKNMLKFIGKILLIGTVTTIVRIIGQLLIPAGSQTVLEASVFVKNGTMPVAFTIYGLFAYSIIASLFLLVKEGINGTRIIRGLKYAISCCMIWVIYLLEPLPHVAFMDKFTYPIADSCALLVMGILAGILLCEKEVSIEKETVKLKWLPTIAISGCFLIGRMIQYCLIDIYSCFEQDKVSSIIWSALTGLIISFVIQWLNQKIIATNKGVKYILIGVVLFGVDLFLFNFFMPLVFDADIPDLILRTCIDIAGTTIGCVSLPNEKV